MGVNSSKPGIPAPRSNHPKYRQPRGFAVPRNGFVERKKGKGTSSRAASSSSSSSSSSRPSFFVNPEEKPFREDRDYNYTISQQDAMEMQERLLRESAARMRSRGTTGTGGRSFTQQPYAAAVTTTLESLTAPILNIHQRYPNHWTWRDPWSRLGLPRHAPASLVKTHYRKLALLYHPDKLKFHDSAERFHAITAAYRKLTT